VFQHNRTKQNHSTGRVDYLNNRFQNAFTIAEPFLQEVSAKIAETVNKIDTAEERELLQYGLSQKGQMLRPGLVYITAFAHNPRLSVAEREETVLFACAVELLHTASLVHDDILDLTEERRGKPSLFHQYGVGSALLAGNSFYLAAFSTAVQFLRNFQVEAIVNAAKEMCSGEILQLAYREKPIPHDIYMDIIRRKTGSLIKYACRESARLAGASLEVLQKMQRLGECFGILYQLFDDSKDKDTNLEPGFDFDYCAAQLIQEADEMINSLDESIYKRSFQGFSNYMKNAFCNRAHAK
jgi:octaprenyl-diphosphate synthase